MPDKRIVDWVSRHHISSHAISDKPVHHRTRHRKQRPDSQPTSRRPHPMSQRSCRRLRSPPVPRSAALDVPPRPAATRTQCSSQLALTAGFTLTFTFTFTFTLRVPTKSNSATFLASIVNFPVIAMIVLNGFVARVGYQPDIVLLYGFFLERRRVGVGAVE